MTNKTKVESEPKEQMWNLFFVCFFAVILVLTGVMFRINNIDIKRIGYYELTLMILASFRLIRLIVYDQIMQYIRDYASSKSNVGFFSAMATLLACPWCVGIWVAPVVVFIAFYIPYGDLFILVFAISGVATIIQLLSNILALNIKEKNYISALLEKNSDK